MATPDTSSIRRHLQVSVTVAVAILYALGALGVFFYVRIEEEREFLESLRQRLELYVAETELEYGGEVGANFHDRTIERFEAIGESLFPNGSEERKPDGAIYYVLRDDEGNTLVRSPWLAYESFLPFHRQQRTGEIVFGQANLSDRRHVRTASTSFTLSRNRPPLGKELSSPPESGETLPENQVHLVLAESDQRMRHMLVILGMSLLAVGVLIMAATAVLIALLVRRACRPIDALGSECARIHSDNLDVRLAGNRTPEELRPLVIQFNALLDRVEEAFKREQRFAMNIAHELRTPVAELRSLAEVALQPPASGEPEESPHEIYRETAEIGRRINRLIETLSDLHRSESGAAPPKLTSVRLTDLLAGIVKPSDSTSRTEQRSIRIEGDPEILVQTDPALARGILDNLIGNALAHSVLTTEVVCRIATSEDESAIQVEILNETDQLGPEDLPHLGEPFWQKDAARSDSDHFGLGLSCVAAYAGILGIEVAYRLEKATFVASIKFPEATRELFAVRRGNTSGIQAEI